MSRIRQVPSLAGGAVRLIEVLKATIVHTVRHDTSSSALGFISALFKPLALLASFYIILSFTPARMLAIRGNTVTFLLTGIFCFLIHTGTITKVANAVRKSRSMLHHAPATIFLYVLSQAFGALYLHLFAALTIIAVAELSGYPLDILSPRGLVLPYLLSWASGLGVGMILMAIGHRAPTAADVISTVYIRVQFFTSGKFWAANVMPAYLSDYAIWNPLLHVIDQMRGAAFRNYFPKFTTITYPIAFTAIVLVVGFMTEFWLRRSFSLSQTKR
ncbi:MAG: hypothetical protein D6754_07780 [Alphaproteobacteria bacterium]|nr:MAG: hypothetical protein D6754_07780 [Alphaproteobacteria bacterium]